MAEAKSNELLAQDISYIKKDLADIKTKLEEKYVSHETFDLTVNSLNMAIKTSSEASQSAIKLIAKIGLFIITPIYGAVIALLFKTFI